MQRITKGRKGVVAASNSSELVSQLAREIAQLPNSVKLGARQGFEISAALTEAEQRRAVALVVSAFEGDLGGFDAEALTKEIPSLTGRDAGRLATALSVVAALLTQHAVTIDEFLQAARNNFYDEGAEQPVRLAAELVISHRHTLTAAVERQRLENVVLPSLTDFSVAVDVRIRFANEQPIGFVPIAVVHIDTDGSNQEIWCQLSRADINRIIEKLQNTVREMELVGNLIRPVVPESSN